MKRIILAFLVLLNSVQLQAADYYWIGGGGNWSDLNGHWRLGSPTGGVPSIVPAAGDNVFFGSYSGFGTTAATRTVTLDANAFCANMTWDNNVPNSPILARGGSNTLFVHGSLVLAPTVTYNNAVDVVFAGSSPATLTANGDVNGILNLTINKPGSGLTLMDDLIYTGTTTENSYGITLTAGYLDASEKQVAVFSFTSNNNNIRHLDITGGRLTLARNLYFQGTNKTIAATGSFIQVGIRLMTDGGEFDEVESLSSSPNNDLFAVYNTTFRKLVFSNTSLTSNARIHANNTVDSLIFKGAGIVREANNEIRYLSIAGNATIGGSNNVIQYASIGGVMDFIDNGGHVIDSLLTAPNKNIYVTRTVTINKYFRAGGEPCDGFTEITGYTGGTLHFADEAKVEIDNVLLTGIRATGSITPIAVNGIDNEGNNGFIINPPPTTNRTLYWVGGAGDWNDRSHWSDVSGGPGGACIPFIGDDVVFDGGSGLNTGATVATSGNTYCHNMTWAAGIAGSPIFAVNANFLMQVYGSIVMSPSVTMNARLDMRGTEGVTVTTNGNQAGTNRILVRKEGAGGVTFLDDWRNTAGIVQLNVGYLDIAGRTIDINIFTSGTNGIRHVDMEGATVTVTRWEFRGNNKTLAADGSLLTIKNSVSMANVLVQYDVVDISAGPVNTDNFSIEQAGFRELTFSNPSLTSSARIGANNIIDRLEFKGRGTIAGTGNQIGSLITAENRNLWFGDGTSNTINNYFKAVHPACSGLGEIRSLGSSSTVVFGADATVEIANVYMENIIATGGGGTLTLPITFSGADAGGNAGWDIVTSDGDARYWVGGAGDWNDASHWSTTSGGPGGACIPTVANDVYFDANSGFGTTTATKTVTINNGNAYFGNISWAGVANNPILNKADAWNMEAWGETVVLNPTVTLNAIIQFRGTTETTITGQALGNLDMELRKSGGGLVIANDFSNSQTDIFLYQGSLEARDITLNIRSVDNGGRNNNISVDITGSTVHAANLWEYNGSTSNRSLLAADSKITTYQFHAVGFAYGHVEVTGVFSHQGAFSDITASKMVFLDQNVASNIGINGTNNQLDTVEFKGGGTIYGTNNTIGTLIFFPGSQYTFVAGTNTTITDDWFGSGTPCRLTEIRSSTTSNATVTKVAGEVNFDYVRLQRITATGGAEFTAGSHSQDLGGSSGWDIAPYDGASPIEGLGPDVSLSTTEFPYTISAAGFFGSPLSRYEWRKDGTVVGNADELVITEPGEYTIKVDFPDGCSVTDEIMISLDVADLVTVKTLKEATPASYIPGEEVVYTITITNNGPDDAVNVNVTDEAPTETAITAWTATVVTGTVDLPNISGSGTLSETIPLLPNGAEVVYEVTLATSAGRTADLSNSVAVTSVTPDPEPDCDACTTVPIPAAPIAAVSVSKALADDTQQGYIPGEEVIYVITVTNDGPSDARQVIVEDTAPAGSAIDSWTATVTTGEVTLPGTSGTDALNETIAVLPSGAVVTYEVTVQTSNAMADDLVNTATVTSDTEDPDDADNTAMTIGLPAVPDAPVSGGDQEACAESPLQTLTATATVPAGVTIVWYDAASGGDVVLAPTLNAIGTITYYAEAQKGPLISLSRTAVTLTINELPNLVITDPAIACVGTTIDLTAAVVTAGSDAGLTYTYHTDAAGLVVLDDPDAVAISGMYYIKGTNPETGCSVTMPVTVQFVDRPVVTVTHPDCVVGTGSIAITEPLGAGFEYSINGVDYQTDPLFENIAPGTYQVTAQHTSVPGCVSEEFEVIINATPTTATPIVVDPICGETTGSVEFPADAGYEYAVYQTGGTPVYQSSSVFTDLAPGEYLVQMRTVDCEAAPVMVTISEAPEVPVAPVSDGDLEECAAAPIQTLTATATAPAGITITWYDQPIGGNVVADPSLSTVGTATYYAEASNDDCVSETRTAVTLTINAQPVIDVLEDQVVCGSFTLPSITGTNLSGDMAYYTESGGNGTRYDIGATISLAGTYTLYQYVAPADGCVAESEFTLTINETPGAGTIGADQAICYGEIPEELVSVAAGTGTGIVAYRWEVSADGTAWSVITGATEATYQPGELTATTHYRRITVATANGLTCESAPTDAAVITVAGELIADAGEDQEQFNSGEFTLNASASGGTGAWTVVSGAPLEALSDSNDPNATITLEANSSVTLQWTVSEAACSVSDEVVLTYIAQADLVTVKTPRIGGQTTYTAGEAVDYIITVRNYGPSDALNVTIKDTAPFGTNITSWSASVIGGTVTLPETSGSGDLDQTIAVVPNGATVLYEVSVQTPSDFTDPLVNVVEVGSETADPEPTCTGCETTPMLAGDAQADIITVKELADVSQVSYVPGTEVVYTITVTNDGPSDAAGVTVVDVAPAGTTISGWTAEVTAGMATLPNMSGTGDLDETITDLPNGATVTYTVTVQTPSDFTEDLINTVTVASATTDPDPECTDCSTVPLPAGDPLADLETVKLLSDAGQTAFAPGESVEYRITVTNHGPSDAADVNIWDLAPTGTTITGWTAEVTSGIVTLPNARGTGNLNETIALLPDGAEVIYTVTVQTPSDFEDDLVNIVTVTSPTEDPNPDCTTCATMPLPGVPEADIETVKVTSDADQTTFVPGETVEYIISVNNNGPSDAANVTIQDTAPAGTTITGWTAEVIAGAVTLPNVTGTGDLDETIALLPNGAAVTYTITVQTPSDFDNDLVNTVTVTSPTDDPNPGCTACATTPLPAAPEADIETVKVTSDAGQTEFAPGENVEYTITVTNHGPSDAANVAIQDTAPAGTTITGWTATVTAGTVTLPNVSGTGNLNETLLVLPNGAVVTYEVTVSTTTETTADLVNTGEVSSDTDDPDLANNTATTPALPAIPAPPVSGGDQEVCVVSPAQVLTATATVPEGVTIVWYDAPSGGNVVEAPLLDAVGTVTYYAEAVKGLLVSVSRTTVTLTINGLPNLVITDPAAACEGETVDLTAAAVIAGSDAGLMYSYHTDAAGTGVLENADAITVSGIYYIRAINPITGCTTVAPVSVQFVERPLVTVTHPDCADGATGSITITSPLGAGLDYAVYAPGETPVYSAEIQYEGLMPGMTYQVVARATAANCVSEPLEVTINVRPVTVMPTVVDPQCGEATGSMAFPVDPDHEYAIYKAGETPVYQSSPTFTDLAPGEYLAQMRSVVIDCEATPVNVVINAAPEGPAAPISGGNQEVCVENASLPLRATATVPDGLTVIWYDAPSGGNVVTSPILEAIGTVTYYAEAGNGNCMSETRTAVTLTILEALVADAGADQTKAKGPVFTLDGNMPASTIGTWTVVSGVPSGAISDIHDPQATVSLTPGTSVTLRWTIGNGSCDATDEVVLTLLPEAPEVKADLAITKTVDNETSLAGGTVVFTVEALNAGPDDAIGVEVLDKLPSGYTFVSDEASVGSYDEASGIWTIGGLANGAKATLLVTATVNVEGEHLNHAQVRGNEEDPNTDDNEATAAVMPVQPPQVVDDAATGNSNKAVVISILANDAELTYPIDVASIEIVTQPQHGTVSIGTDGTIAYVSDAGYVGEDRFSYRVKDSEGHWSDTAEVVITVAANPLRIPNIFTPNGDGQNDRFEIIGIEGFNRAELVVFNRWGNEIYRHNNYDNSWGGGDIHEGTYYYMLTLHNGSSKQVEKGWVVLKKQ